MRLLIIGATRGIGEQLLSQALGAGHVVTVLARDPAKIALTAENLIVHKGDIRDGTVVSAAVQDQEAVCVTIGVPITFKPVTLFSEGIVQVIDAMRQHRVQRLICVTGIGAGNSKGHGGFLYDSIFKPLFLRSIYADKDIQEQYVKESGLDWVIVRPAGLTDGACTKKYRIVTDLDGVTSTRISRADVAHFIISELSEQKYTAKTPLLTY
ncbi:MAG: SDR family oxidoreductase [Desulforhopalus sp.]